jgi:MFS family permease
VLAMFVPSFFTGSLILRFGVERIVILGLALLFTSAMVGIAGISLAHFWGMLVLLGVGWNFAFVGATTMVTQTHTRDECNKVQAFNDFLVFGSMGIGSFSSGLLLAGYGWQAVNEVVLPVVILVAGLVIWRTWREHCRVAKSAG